MPDTVERFNALNLEAVSSTPQQFGAVLVKHLRKYAEIAQRASIEPKRKANRSRLVRQVKAAAIAGA